MSLHLASETEIIVEIGNTHEGSVGIAQSFINMAASSGAKTVKFQMHIAEEEGTKDEPFRVKFSNQDKTRQDYWRRVNFKIQDWVFLANYCKELQVEFLCTPFSIKAAQILHENALVKRWKVGSGQATDFPLIDYLVSTGLPIIISTGLVDYAEISKLRERLLRVNSWSRITLLHCVSKYPVPISEIDLPLMEKLKAFDCPVGYSDHSGNEFVIMSAIALGASIIELHMTPRSDFFGPDVSSSHTPEQLSRIIQFSRMFHELKNSIGTKEKHFESVKELRKLFRKGIYWAVNKKAGEVVSVEDLQFLKPVAEVDVIDFEIFLGKPVSHDVQAGNPLSKSDFVTK